MRFAHEYAGARCVNCGAPRDMPAVDCVRRVPFRACGFSWIATVRGDGRVTIDGLCLGIWSVPVLRGVWRGALTDVAPLAWGFALFPGIDVDELVAAATTTMEVLRDD